MTPAPAAGTAIKGAVRVGNPYSIASARLVVHSPLTEHYTTTVPPPLLQMGRAGRCHFAEPITTNGEFRIADGFSGLALTRALGRFCRQTTLGEASSDDGSATSQGQCKAFRATKAFTPARDRASLIAGTTARIASSEVSRAGGRDNQESSAAGCRRMLVPHGRDNAPR